MQPIAIPVQAWRGNNNNNKSNSKENSPKIQIPRQFIQNVNAHATVSFLLSVHCFYDEFLPLKTLNQTSLSKQVDKQNKQTYKQAHPGC